MQIDGEITSQTCTVSNASSGTIQVTLDKIGKSALSANDSTAAAKPFSITLKDCGAASTDNKTVGIYFSSLPTTGTISSQGNLQGVTADNLSNVQVQLLNANKEAIKLGSSNADQHPVEQTLSGSTTELTYNFFAQYYTPDSSALKAGKVQVAIPFNIVYK